MGELIIKHKCGRCRGSGIDDNVFDAFGHLVPESCSPCSGSGYLAHAKADATFLLQSISNCPTYIILENTKGSEYVDLSDDQKAVYMLYISAGVLDMQVGTKARDIFLAWLFPPGTTSYTDILAALNAL